jgi:hypothetical protein
LLCEAATAPTSPARIASHNAITQVLSASTSSAAMANTGSARRGSMRASLRTNGCHSRNSP